MNDQENPRTEGEAAPVHKKRWVLWTAVLLLLVGLGALYYYVPLPKDLAGLTAIVPVPKEKESESLVDRVAALEEALAALPQAAPVSNATLSAIATDIASLDSRLAALERWVAEGSETGESGTLKPEVEKLQSDLQSLSSRLAGLEEASKQTASTDIFADPRLRAIEELREGLWEYGPFSERLTALLAVAGNDATVRKLLAPITAYADQGIPTLPMLRARFDDMAAAVLEAGWVKPKADWREKLLANLANLVTIRRTGNLEGDDLEAVLARAEVALNAGDLERTVTLLDGVGEPARKAAEFWLRDARARLAAEAAIRQLRQMAFSPTKAPAESQQ
ncbi:MAG: COG4223 family protein [Alphaproteobacteria bacterium]